MTVLSEWAMGIQGMYLLVTISVWMPDNIHSLLLLEMLPAIFISSCSYISLKRPQLDIIYFRELMMLLYIPDGRAEVVD
jgi:hypothetical protein